LAFIPEEREKHSIKKYSLLLPSYLGSVMWTAVNVFHHRFVIATNIPPKKRDKLWDGKPTMLSGRVWRLIHHRQDWYGNQW